MKLIIVWYLFLLSQYYFEPMHMQPLPEELMQEQWVYISYYTASDDECGKADGITASGVKAVEGITVAADHLEFGTVVEIDGRRYIVQDRFGGGYRDKIDVFANDRGYALQQGIQIKKIKIISQHE